MDTTSAGVIWWPSCYWHLAATLHTELSQLAGARHQLSAGARNTLQLSEHSGDTISPLSRSSYSLTEEENRTHSFAVLMSQVMSPCQKIHAEGGSNYKFKFIFQ